MPQDDKPSAQRAKKMNKVISDNKSTPEKEAAFAAARKSVADYKSVTPTKKGPVLNSSNSAGVIQRGMSSPSLDHIQSAEQERMRVRDTPLSATPDAMLATPKIKNN